MAASAIGSNKRGPGELWNRSATSGILAWNAQQQRTVERGGMVISVDVNPQPAPDHLHVLTSQVVRTRRMPCGDFPNLN